MEQTILITSASNGNNPRIQAIRGLIKRRSELEEWVPLPQVSNDDLVHAIQKLHHAERFYPREKPAGGFQLLYVPSRQAKEQLFSASPSPAWEKVQKKHRNAFRLSTGALFRLPLDGREGFLEAFITDWSPFPAAAAVAIHKAHPLANSRVRQSGDYFTGHFVRHPLTGDLLPVWVGSWVKPEFGTGVVIVNPAHSTADLAFARSVGLPARFCLVNDPVSSDPLTWPTPPVIKVGKTIKTGRFDDLSVGEAMERYFEELNKNGLAEKYVDKGIDSFPMVSLRHDDAGEVLFCEACGAVQCRSEQTVATCQSCVQEYIPVSIEPYGILRSLLAVAESNSLELFCAASEVETALLLARLLFYDLQGKNLVPERFFSLAGIETTKMNLPIEICDLATIASAPLGQVAVFKRQILDQVQAFLARHQELIQSYGESSWPTEQPYHVLRNQLARVKEHLVSWRLNEAFSVLYAAQKELSKEPNDAVLGLLPEYFALAFVLAGYAYPRGLGATDVWNRL